jgi:hypothetical protein
MTGISRRPGDTSAVLGRRIKIDDGEAQELNRDDFRNWLVAAA